MFDNANVKPSVGPPGQCQVCGGKEWQAAKPGNHTESQRLRSPVTLWGRRPIRGQPGPALTNQRPPVPCLHHQTGRDMDADTLTRYTLGKHKGLMV